jgi:hypothetical protein
MDCIKKYLIVINAFFISTFCLAQEDNIYLPEPMFNKPETKEHIYEQAEIEIIKKETQIFSHPKKTGEILFKAKDGCSESKFKIKRTFYDDRTINDNIIVYSYDELSQLKEKYFELPYFDTISEDFFKTNLLVFVFVRHNGGTELKNEKIEIENFKYMLIIEEWLPSDGYYYLCEDTVLYLLKITK